MTHSCWVGIEISLSIIGKVKKKKKKKEKIGKWIKNEGEVEKKYRLCWSRNQSVWSSD